MLSLTGLLDIVSIIYLFFSKFLDLMIARDSGKHNYNIFWGTIKWKSYLKSAVHGAGA